MKILAFAGSTSSDSINKKLINFVVSKFEGEDVEILDLNDYEMPLFSLDREKEIGTHPLAIKFAEKIDASDLIIMSLAEYNSAYSAAFKNVFDWVSRVPNRKHFGDKPVFLLSTSPGGRGGQNVSEIFMQRAPHSGANVITNFILPFFGQNFEEGKGIVNEELNAELEEKIKLVKSQF